MTTYIANRNNCARQGDVLLIPNPTVADEELGDKVLDGASDHRIVLAHGEVTGHAHAFYPNQDTPEPKSAKPGLYELTDPGKYSALPCRLLRLDGTAIPHTMRLRQRLD